MELILNTSIDIFCMLYINEAESSLPESHYSVYTVPDSLKPLPGQQYSGVCTFKYITVSSSQNISTTMHCLTIYMYSCTHKQRMFHGYSCHPSWIFMTFTRDKEKKRHLSQNPFVSSPTKNKLNISIHVKYFSGKWIFTNINVQQTFGRYRSQRRYHKATIPAIHLYTFSQPEMNNEQLTWTFINLMLCYDAVYIC